jgi:hypothetical protein
MTEDENSSERNLATSNLAKMHLYFGMGAEASALLSTRAKNSNYARLLMELARFFEHPNENNVENIFTSECGSLHMFWNFATTGTLSSNETNFILSYASKLPIHLRKIIVPVLGNRFMELGFVEEAQFILRILDRQDFSRTQMGEILKARVNSLEEKFEESQENYIDALRGTRQATAEALLEYSYLAAREKLKLPFGYSTIVEGEIFSTEDVAVSEILMQTLIVAKIVEDDIFDALDLIVANRNFFSILDNELDMNLIFRDVLTEMSDGEIIFLAFNYLEPVSQIFERDVLDVFYSRLKGVGFEELFLTSNVLSSNISHGELAAENETLGVQQDSNRRQVEAIDSSVDIDQKLEVERNDGLLQFQSDFPNWRQSNSIGSLSQLVALSSDTVERTEFLLGGSLDEE